MILSLDTDVLQEGVQTGSKRWGTALERKPRLLRAACSLSIYIYLYIYKTVLRRLLWGIYQLHLPMRLLMPIGVGEALRSYWIKGLWREDQTWRLPGERPGMMGWEGGVELKAT